MWDCWPWLCLIADYSILPPALKSFRAQFPLVEVQLHELTTDAQIRELRGARLDLGIGLAPSRTGPGIQECPSRGADLAACRARRGTR